MGSNHHSLGVALGALFLASCAGQNVETTAASQEPAAEADAKDVIVTGSRIQVGNLEATSEFAIGTVVPPAPPPPPAAVMAAPMRQDRRAWPPFYKDVGRDKFNSFAENAFKIVREAPVSTFSIDVDTASYSWVRASLNQNVLPQPAAVRTEELVNYFTYDYAPPKSAAQPFSTNVAVFPSPWSEGRKLVRIGIKGFAVQRRRVGRAR
jgi:Ca-activated chloride channel family protein